MTLGCIRNSDAHPCVGFDTNKASASPPSVQIE
jgi:hypothetical protein